MNSFVTSFHGFQSYTQCWTQAKYILHLFSVLLLCTKTTLQLTENLLGSLSPSREDRNDTRYPHVIFMAECVHRGCIINGEETDAYNSVVVATNMNVFYKHQCAHDRSKHILTHSLITVPVSCTCVEPKYWGPPADRPNIRRRPPSTFPLGVLFENCNDVNVRSDFPLAARPGSCVSAQNWKT